MKQYYFVFVLLMFCAFFFSPKKTYAQDEYAAVTDVAPVIAGGEESLYKHINYPDLAKKNRIEGKVYIIVLINEKGDVDEANVIKGIGFGCDEAAVAALKKSKFSPGKNGGTAVKSKLTMAINFKVK